jgi:uncharacterized Zn-binding protein involved in type VI secretion
MTRYWIKVGDTTSGGGTVLSGAAHDPAGGLAWARIGDSVQCGVHGMTTIVTGDSEHPIDGRAAARHGDFCACGCILISRSQIQCIAEMGGGFAAAREM